MASSSLTTREGIASEDERFKAYRDVVSAVALRSMESFTLNADIFGNRITEIQELCVSKLHAYKILTSLEQYESAEQSPWSSRDGKTRREKKKK
ncbi:hypothetical protein BOTNAR_0114g00090 [Botryotinia narcissicola]|uniref:Uncharacterized protein n=1 Tax=Botryotinia narcissicola TaxID=278944 RepID=A0A4Z1ISW5_9HELO|nr:hypothetical protein BOTNAR_0114g00090 [Botryotinia narcissicola]